MTSGAVTATLEDGRLSIVRGGVEAFAAPIPTWCATAACSRAPTTSGSIDFDGDGEREVLVVAFTGGQGCCTVSGIYSFNGSGYDETVHRLALGGLRDRRPRPRRPPRARLARHALRGPYTSHAASFPPPAVYRFLTQDGEPVLVDITRSFPALIRRNAATAKREIRKLGRRDPDAGGVVSAYVADQYLLGPRPDRAARARPAGLAPRRRPRVQAAPAPRPQKVRLPLTGPTQVGVRRLQRAPQLVVLARAGLDWHLLLRRIASGAARRSSARAPARDAAARLRHREQLGDEHGYPLEDNYDLARVAQYVAVQQTTRCTPRS